MTLRNGLEDEHRSVGTEPHHPARLDDAMSGLGQYEVDPVELHGQGVLGHSHVFLALRALAVGYHLAAEALLAVGRDAESHPRRLSCREGLVAFHPLSGVADDPVERGTPVAIVPTDDFHWPLLRRFALRRTSKLIIPYTQGSASSAGKLCLQAFLRSFRRKCKTAPEGDLHFVSSSASWTTLGLITRIAQNTSSFHGYLLMPF